ncbi:DUF1513 domain-containing protein [Mesorhizobium sp. NBSH29]|uniref:DUF1513 domain-containing protein n=1 Tax=Mesorhizobium sp. NBSH29 TaxID=2654249 RepID=UPI0018968009|nr:DUF1513 domain-containing protein [Mesorhizobium sp. NBSH29]QPC86462.1 DUF1513 domain-containing protein [Mesorhizobium sp. NBSH29]
MLISRRAFLRAAGAGFTAMLSPSALGAVEAADAVYATAFQRRDGTYGVGILSEDRQLLFTAPLPDRGHDVTFDPVSRRAVVFARRPGTFAVVFDHVSERAPLTITSVEGRHFFGHGVFSPDGKLLYATENDFDNAAGMIGVYDATQKFTRVGEFPTHGMDPHDLLLMADGKTLAIANGGIETHPDFGRAKLNLATMQPSLVFLDREHGSLVERHVLPTRLHQLSIRHMDVDGAGIVWFGCQYEGPASDFPPLVGRAAPGAEFSLIDMPQDALSSLRNYVGSVTTNREAGTVAVTSPQGNRLAIIDAATGTMRATQSLTEVCGIAPKGDSFLATSGTGTILDAAGQRTVMDDYVWDNHLLRITQPPA